MGIRSEVRAGLALAALMVLLGSCSGGGGNGGDTGGNANPGPTGPGTPTPTPPATGPLTLTITNGFNQGGPSGVILGQTLGLKVTNSSGAAVSGVTVTWTAAAMNGTVASATSITDAAGAASNSWTLSPVIAQQKVVASVPNGVSTATFSGSVVVTSLTFSQVNATAFVGDTIALAAVAKDSRGTLMTDAVPLTVKTAGVAAATANGRIAALKNGTTYVVGTAGTLKDSTLLDVYTKLHGTVHTFDGSTLPALRAYSTNGALTDSANVNADGTYSLGVRSHFTTGYNTEILIDAVDKSNRKFFPSLTPISITCKGDFSCIGSFLDSAQNVILVPRQYTVTRGRFAGQTLNVDLDAAYDENPGVQPSYLNASGDDNTSYPVNGVRTDRKLFTTSEYFWLPDSFPVAVAMHRSQSTSPFPNAAADSLALWATLNEVQTALGFNIWYPVNDNPAWSIPYTGQADPRVPNRTYLIVINDTINPGHSGGGGTGPLLDNLGVRSPSILGLVDFQVTGWRGTKVDHWADAVEMPQRQSVEVANEAVLSDPVVMTHETMHTLAVGHGCHWVSTQSYCQQYTALDGKVRFEDAAYLLLSMAIQKASWQYRAPLGLPSALFGQRAIVEGLPPIPEDWSIPDPTGGAASGNNDVIPARRPGIPGKPQRE